MADRTGQLPYLTHGLHTVTGFHGILGYVASIAKKDLNASLNIQQKAQITARTAHVESTLGDLVVNSPFSNFVSDQLTDARSNRLMSIMC